MMKKLIIGLLTCLIFSASSWAADYTLEWDANTESDLAGYRLCYKVDGPGPPYDGGTIDVGNVTTYTWTGLPGKDDLAPGQRIRFVCIAYNTLGWESGFSNEPSVGVPANPTLRITAVSSP